MPEQPLDSTGCSSIQFFNSIFVTCEIRCSAIGHQCHLIFCDSTMCFNHVPLPPHIANLLLTKRYYLVGFIYVFGGAAIYYINHLSLVLNSLN